MSSLRPSAVGSVGFAFVKALGLVGSGGFKRKDRVSNLGEDMRQHLLPRRIWDSGGSLGSWGSDSAAPPFNFGRVSGWVHGGESRVWEVFDPVVFQLPMVGVRRSCLPSPIWSFFLEIKGRP